MFLFFFFKQKTAYEMRISAGVQTCALPICREFQDVLARYGEDVILPIHYFLTHEIFTLELMRGLSDTARTALHSVRRLWSQSQSVQADSNGEIGRASCRERVCQYV